MNINFFFFFLELDRNTLNILTVCKYNDQYSIATLETIYWCEQTNDWYQIKLLVLYNNAWSLLTVC